MTMDESKVTCSDCNKMFQFEESLVVHHSVCLKHQDNKSRRSFSCEQCGNSFKTMTILRNHARTHTSYFDITKELYDQTLRSIFSLDSTVNTSVLESTRTLDAGIAESTYTCDTSSTDTCIADTTYTCDISTTGTRITGTTYTCDTSTTGTCIADTTHTCDTISTDTCKSTEADITITEISTNSSTTSTVDKHSDKTYVFTKADHDDKEVVLGLDKTYVSDGGKRLSADITYLLQNTARAEPIDKVKGICALPIDTPRGFADHVIRFSRSRSGITVPLFSKKLFNDQPTKESTLFNNSPFRGFTARASVKSIRTLRNHRSRPGTPVNVSKVRNTPGRKARSKSRSRAPGRNQSSVRSVTPNLERCSKYAVRITAHSGIDAMEADSLFRLTPLSTKVTPHSKRKDTPGGATYKCRKCGKAFNDKDQFDIHYVIHARDIPVTCGIPSDCYKKNNCKIQFSTPDKKVNRVLKFTPVFRLSPLPAVLSE